MFHGSGGLILQNRARAVSSLICDITQHSCGRPEPEKAEGWKRWIPRDWPGSLLMTLKEGQETLFLWLKVAETKHRVDWWLAIKAAFGGSIFLRSALWPPLIESLDALWLGQGVSPASVYHQGAWELREPGRVEACVTYVWLQICPLFGMPSHELLAHIFVF